MSVTISGQGNPVRSHGVCVYRCQGDLDAIALVATVAGIDTWPTKWNAPKMKLPTHVAVTLLLFSQLGCAAGYRHQWGAAEARSHGLGAHVETDADMFWGGVVLDVRFVRVLFPRQEFIHHQRIVDERGGRDGDHGRQTRQTFELDVPLVSVWTPEAGLGMGYPPLHKMRKGLEVWATGTVEVEGGRWYALEASAVYYHAPWAAMKVFGGWQSSTYEGATTYIDQPLGVIWEGRTSGPSVGAELTLFSGEYALNVLKWLFERDEEYRREFGDD